MYNFRVHLNNTQSRAIADGVTVTIKAKRKPAFAGNAAETVEFLQALGVGVSVEIRHDLGARSCMNKPALWDWIQFMGKKPEDSEVCKFYPLPDYSGFIGVNDGAGLYVIPCDSGYTCLGFDVCLRWTRGVAEWLALKPRYTERGSVDAYAQYLEIMAAGRKRAQETGRQCLDDLQPALIGLEGKTVVIEREGEELQRGRVSRSTGWRPCHLIVAPRKKYGESAYVPDGATVRTI
jgi:hypothetical protein